MATIQELKKYVNYEFSSGYFTGKDYLTFQTKYINYLKSICKEYGWELCNVGKNHYEFSAFFKYQNKYIYFSISNVRYFKNEWFNNILYRVARTDKDYTGGQNLYTNLANLKYVIYGLFNKDNLWK